MAPANLLLCFFNSRMYTFQYNKCFPIVLQTCVSFKIQFLTVSQVTESRGSERVYVLSTHHAECYRSGEACVLFSFRVVVFSKLMPLKTGYSSNVPHLRWKQPDFLIRGTPVL